MSWEFGTVQSVCSQCCHQLGQLGEPPQLRPSSWEKPPWPEQPHGQGDAVGAALPGGGTQGASFGKQGAPGLRGHCQPSTVALLLSHAVCLTPVRQG